MVFGPQVHPSREFPSLFHSLYHFLLSNCGFSLRSTSVITLSYPCTSHLSIALSVYLSFSFFTHQQSSPWGTLVDIMHSLAPYTDLSHHNKIPTTNLNLILALAIKPSFKPQKAFSAKRDLTSSHRLLSIQVEVPTIV